MTVKELLEILHPDIDIMLYYRNAEIHFMTTDLDDFWNNLKVVPGTIIIDTNYGDNNLSMEVID